MPFRWPGEHEESPDLSFPSATDAVTFLSRHMDGDIALPTWVPSNVDLDTTASVFLATRDGVRLAQLKVATERGGIWGIQYGVAGLDGCAPEHSVPVKVSGQPGRLRVSADPDGSSRTWVQLVGPRRSSTPTACSACSGGSRHEPYSRWPSRCRLCPRRRSTRLWAADGRCGPSLLAVGQVRHSGLARSLPEGTVSASPIRRVKLPVDGAGPVASDRCARPPSRRSPHRWAQRPVVGAPAGP